MPLKRIHQCSEFDLLAFDMVRGQSIQIASCLIKTMENTLLFLSLGGSNLRMDHGSDLDFSNQGKNQSQFKVPGQNLNFKLKSLDRISIFIEILSRHPFLRTRVRTTSCAHPLACQWQRDCALELVTREEDRHIAKPSNSNLSTKQSLVHWEEMWKGKEQGERLRGTRHVAINLRMVRGMLQAFTDS